AVEPLVDDVEAALAVVVLGVVLEDCGGAENCGGERAEERDRGDEALPGALSERAVDQEPDEGQDRDQPEFVEHALRRLLSCWVAGLLTSNQQPRNSATQQPVSPHTSRCEVTLQPA